jgi:manganese transport protein
MQKFPMDSRLSKQRKAWRLKAFLGPALVAGVAYIDPGNIATNLTAGSRFGYLLIWVLLLATISAALFQFLSAKLGTVTGKSLPALLGERISSDKLRVAFWIQAEAVAIATDIAEVLGGAIALSVLSRAPLLLCASIVAVISLVITWFRQRGKTQFNNIVILLMLAATVGFSYIMLVSKVDWPDFASGMVPQFNGTSSLLLATSIIGATIMPHAIYAHSSLSRDNAQDQTMADRVRALSTDVAIAMILAGLGNIAVMVFSATNLRGAADATMESAPALLDKNLGAGVGLIFVLALFSSGLASSVVGNFAAGEISVGLLRRRIPPLVRWLLALAPALLIIAFTANVTDAIVYSQVILSFGLPFALFPLIRLTSSRSVMGEFASSRLVTATGYWLASILTFINIWLVSSLTMGY